MKEQIATLIVDTEAALNQAISDLRFYYGIAKHRNVPFEIDVWAERGAIIVPQPISVRRNHETHVVRQEQSSG